MGRGGEEGIREREGRRRGGEGRSEKEEEEE